MKDHAVEEIRERRRQLLKGQYGGSIRRWIDEAIEWQEQHPERVVDLRHRQGRKTVVV